MKKNSKLIIAYSIILLLIIVSILTGYISLIDSSVSHFIQNLAVDFRLHNYLSIFSFIFSPLHTVILIAVLLLGLFILNKKKVLLYLIFSVTSIIIGTLLKYTVQRPRPSDLIDGYSFPSLHTLILFVAIFVLLALYNKGIVKVISVIVIISMMCSRIYLNAHFFSDTLSSLIIVHLVFLCVNKIPKKYTIY
ncbi:phosphatase PAP2 family protein [Mammaliicoccus fleurettii]|uniref:phosphatase PAP2 family protein n=1 Tax=Mammaliicoccus fleurettii TaxID=150056 RepID=UPI001AACE1F6|nr:phosphatase PAP2 family protein [Mammaliicoccus fleurettii]MBO3061513.1 phosphatase PAP2 family protein [Mammaliicoccus fleurettii]